MDKHNTSENACGHLIDFMGVQEQVEKFGRGASDLELFRLEKIEGKAENFAVQTRKETMKLSFR